MRATLLIALLGTLMALPGCSAPSAPQPAEGPVVVRYSESQQIEITSPSGTQVYIDVLRRSDISRPPTANDVLLATSSTYEAFDRGFAEAFPGQKLIMREGELRVGDVRVTGIASSDHESLAPDPAKAGNYIYVIETGGLRLAHFGIIAQKELTREQLDTLGHIDIAITQLANSYSTMSIVNKKGFNLMDQLRPAVVIPTHLDRRTTSYAVEHWSGRYAEGSSVTFLRSNLPATTTVIFMGEGAKSLGALLKIEPWESVK